MKRYQKSIFIIVSSIVIPLLVIVPICIYKYKQKQRLGIEHIWYGKKPNPNECVHPDGIDLSHHNVAYNWGKVDAKFVYVRATFGTSKKDSRYHTHRKAARKHHIPVGAYHFLIANVSAEEQFEYFASVVKKEDVDLRPVLDIEESDYWHAPKGLTDWDAHLFIRKWCDLCKKKYGMAPMIYTTEKLYQRYELNKGFADCIWWVANYNEGKGYYKKCIIPYTIHQYSDKKFVEGFYGYVDCNRFYPGKNVQNIKLR